MTFDLGANGEPMARRAAGGLATAIGSAIVGTDAIWIAASLSEADRRVAREGLIESQGFRISLLNLEPEVFAPFYNTVANGTLWFLHHGLFDASRRPRFDRHFHAAWSIFREVNERFTRAVVEQAPEGALVLVHDYHLSLMGSALAAARPDLTSVHFHHTPFCDPASLAMLPDAVAHELVEGLSGFAACGFHSPRWAQSFESCATSVLGTAPATFVSPVATDADDLARTVASGRCRDALDQLHAQVGTRKLVVRVDRIELSKNLLRGFLAFDDLLETHPEWRERVTFLAFVYPSREGLVEYLAYRTEVEGLVRRINDRWRTPDWEPILYEDTDDYPRSIAALCLYDVLLVNPIRDGFNLVAKEGPLVNQRNGVLALSREAGAWDELGGAALEVNPFDVSGTSDVLHTALSMPEDQRERHAAVLRERAGARRPDDWFLDQVRGAEARRPSPQGARSSVKPL